MQLLAQYGDDAWVFLLQCLFKDAEFKRRDRDNMKLPLLHSELSKLVHRENFVSILCRSYTDVVAQGTVLPPIAQIAAALQLGPETKMMMGVALAQAPNTHIAEAGMTWLEAQIMALIVNSDKGNVGRFSHNIVHKLLTLLACEPALKRHRDAVIRVLKPLFPQTVAEWLGVSPVLTAEDSEKLDLNRCVFRELKDGELKLGAYRSCVLLALATTRRASWIRLQALRA